MTAVVRPDRPINIEIRLALSQLQRVPWPEVVRWLVAEQLVWVGDHQWAPYNGAAVHELCAYIARAAT